MDSCSVVPVVDLQDEIEVDTEEDVAWLVDSVELLYLFLSSTYKDEVELIFFLVMLLEEIDMDVTLHAEEGSRDRGAFYVEWDRHYLFAFYSC